MTISLIFKIASAGILICVLNMILESAQRKDLCFIVNLAGIILVLYWVIPYIAEIFRTIQDLFAM